MANSIDLEKIKSYYATISGQITLGIDGYIDEVWQVLESRNTLETYTTYKKMKQFGERIVACGEGGMSNEIIRKRRSYGGFTGNTGLAVGGLGIKPILIGMYGKDGINPVFREVGAACRLISLGDPAICEIFEFQDGKVMLPYIESILSLNWATLANALNEQALSEAFDSADIIALGYWSSMPAFDEIISKVCERVKHCGPKKIFFDFADINKRDRQALEQTLTALKSLNETAPMTLSLNEHEAASLFAHYNQAFPLDAADAEKHMQAMRECLGLNELVVHTPHFAAMSSSTEGNAAVKQVYCEKPVKTTGAGDNFNGGYITASLGGLNIYERLAVANATTSYYIKNGASPNVGQMVAEIAP